jgi:hypothetical protein
MFDGWTQAEKAKSFEFASKAAVLPLMRHHSRYHAPCVRECRRRQRASTLTAISNNKPAAPTSRPIDAAGRASMLVLRAQRTAETASRMRQEIMQRTKTHKKDGTPEV